VIGWIVGNIIIMMLAGLIIAGIYKPLGEKRAEEKAPAAAPA